MTPGLRQLVSLAEAHPIAVLVQERSDRRLGCGPLADVGAAHQAVHAVRAIQDDEHVGRDAIGLDGLSGAATMTTDAPVVWVGTAESPEGNADVLEVRPAEGQATRLFLDQTTHLPLMMTSTAGFGRGGGGRRGLGPDAAVPQVGTPTPNDGPRRGGTAGQPITIETHLSEYKAVNGIKLPHLITRGVNGQTNEEWEIKSFRINQNLKANTFTK